MQIQRYLLQCLRWRLFQPWILVCFPGGNYTAELLIIEDPLIPVHATHLQG